LTKSELLKVYEHENIHYVPFFPNDFNVVDNRKMREKGFGGGRDWFGVEWTYLERENSVTPTPGSILLDDVTKWREKVVFPDLDALDWESMAAGDESGFDRERRITYAMLECGPFERVQSLLGFENALIAHYDEPEAMHELIDAVTEHRIRLLHKVMEHYRPEVVCMHDDFGANDSMLLSPSLWREFYKDSVKRLAAETHRLGAKYEHHSCGFIQPIIGDLAEAGIDALNPLQACNDAREIKRLYGDRLVLSGGFDNQHVFDNPGSAEEEIRAEVRRVFEILAPGGGYIAFPMSFSSRSIKIIADEIEKIRRDY
jgi:hypothetical protein